MRLKGQVEVVVIVALLVVISVVVVTQLGTQIFSDETPDVRAVRESAQNTIRAAMLDTIQTLGDHGGYLSSSDYPMGSVSFNGQDVPYWQKNGEISYPSKAENFRAGVQAYLEENADSLENILIGVQVGTPQVSTPVFTDGSVTVTVNMPTSYNEVQIPQPYVVKLDTRYSEAYDFSRGFAIYGAEKRPFEYFILSSMVMSPMENGHHSIPVYELLFGCGDYLFATSWDVMPKVDATIQKTLANIYMPDKLPEGTFETSSSPKYSIVPIGNKNFEKLDVSFMLADGFNLNPSNFMMTPDPAIGIAEPIPMVGECMGTDPVEVKYSMAFPVIVRSIDPDTGLAFQYAVTTHISNNLPTPWTTTLTFSQEDSICSNPTCYMDLQVKDSSGLAIEGASVSYMGCYLGTTNAQGGFITAAPCGSGALYIYKRGYGEFIESRGSDEITGDITLLKQPQFTVFLHEVKMTDQGSGKYMVLFGDISPVQNRKALITFLHDATFTSQEFYSNDASFPVAILPAGLHHISGTLSASDYMTQLGAFGLPFNIGEDADEIHIYIPTLPGFSALSTVDKGAKMVEMSEALFDCGIGPVRDSAYHQTEACQAVIS